MNFTTTYDVAKADVASVNLRFKKFKRSKPRLAQLRSKPCRYFARGFCRHGECCTFSHDIKNFTEHLDYMSVQKAWDAQPDSPLGYSDEASSSWPSWRYSKSYYARRYSVDNDPLSSPHSSPRLSPSESDTTFDLVSPLDNYFPVYGRPPSLSSSRSSPSPIASEILVEDSMLRELINAPTVSMLEPLLQRVESPRHASTVSSDSLKDDHRLSQHEWVTMSPTQSPASDPSKDDRPCKFFWKNTCRKGDSCAFSHDSRFADHAVTKSRRASRSCCNTTSPISIRGRTAWLVPLPGTPSVSEQEQAQVKMQGEGWRIIGGGVMLGTDAGERTRSIDCHNRTTLASRSRSRRDEETCPPEPILSFDAMPWHACSPILPQLRSPSTTLEQGDDPVGPLTSGREEEASNVPQGLTVIARPQSTPPWLGMAQSSSVLFCLFKYAEV